uniref:Uncharacterized protein n=1 Tax=Solanum lycopersicum TaxID=4081 RepID=A0A494G9K8_SOLLC
MSPKGTIHWLSRYDGSVAVTALKYNFHRAAGRILCRRRVWHAIIAFGLADSIGL